MSATPLTRILWVDDEPQLLRVLKASLRAHVGEWDMVFVERAEEGLLLMDKAPFDIVVSDMRMPGMNGAVFLNEVMKRHPRTVRVILSGYADQETLMKCVGATHQCYSKPFDPVVLREAIRRICRMQAALSNDAVRSLVNRLSSLPSMPDVFVQLMDALQSPHCLVEDVGRIVARDPAVSAKLLQLVNSAFFGFARDVTDVNEAVQLLGISLVRALTLTVRLFSAFNGRVYRECSIEQVWLRSLRAGWLARQILKEENQPDEVVEQGFTAGLLHDVGMLALVSQLTGPYQEALATARVNRRPLCEVEQEMFGATHPQVGAYMLGLWGLPCALVEAVAFHHSPAANPEASFGPLAAVHVASILAERGAADKGETKPTDGLDMAYLERLNVTHRLGHWTALASQVA